MRCAGGPPVSPLSHRKRPRKALKGPLCRPFNAFYILFTTRLELSVQVRPGTRRRETAANVGAAFKHKPNKRSAAGGHLIALVALGDAEEVLLARGLGSHWPCS